jgi:hypothetical protein
MRRANSAGLLTPCGVVNATLEIGRVQARGLCDHMLSGIGVERLTAPTWRESTRKNLDTDQSLMPQGRCTFDGEAASEMDFGPFQ